MINGDFWRSARGYSNRRLVVTETAPLTEINRRVFCEREDLYPARRSCRPLGSWQRQIKGPRCSRYFFFFFFLLTDKQLCAISKHARFLIQETLAYICMGSVWCRTTDACVESTEKLQICVAKVKIQRLEGVSFWGGGGSFRSCTSEERRSTLRSASQTLLLPNQLWSGEVWGAHKSGVFHCW